MREQLKVPFLKNEQFLHTQHAYEVFICTWHHVIASRLSCTCPMQQAHSLDSFRRLAKRLISIYKLDNGFNDNHRTVFNQFQGYPDSLDSSDRSSVAIVKSEQRWSNQHSNNRAIIAQYRSSTQRKLSPLDWPVHYLHHIASIIFVIFPPTSLTFTKLIV